MYLADNGLPPGASPPILNRANVFPGASALRGFGDPINHGDAGDPGGAEWNKSHDAGDRALFGDIGEAAPAILAGGTGLALLFFGWLVIRALNKS